MQQRARQGQTSEPSLNSRLVRSLPFILTVAIAFSLTAALGALGAPARATLHLPWFGPSGPLDVPAGWFIVLWVLIFSTSLAAVLFFPRGVDRIRSAVVITTIALGLRILLLPMPHSDDVNRYLWEGRILAQGWSPYTHAARPVDGGDARLDELRAPSDPFWRGVNHPEMTAIYPPLMLSLNAAVATISYSAVAFKITMILFDLGTLLLLLALLGRRSQQRWALLYAMSPVVLVAFAGEGHNDAVQLFCITSALLLHRRRRWTWMWLMLGLAVQAKIIALLVCPFFLNRESWKTAPIAGLMALLPFGIFFIFDGSAIFESLLAFGLQMAVNGPIQTSLRLLIGSSAWATLICQALFLVAYCLGLLLTHPARKATPYTTADAGFLATLGALLVFAPTVHAWYVTWLLPLLVLRPTASWLLLSVTIAATYVAYGIEATTGTWTLPLAAVAVVWTGPLLLLFLELALQYSRRRARKKQPAGPAEVASVTVIVPTRNEEQRIKTCLDALNADPVVDQIIVVDAGSTDETVELAQVSGAEILTHDAPFDSGGGRGGQIAAALAKGDPRGEVIAVVHADTEVAEGALSRAVELLRERPDVIGGALGAVFDGSGFALRLVEAANDLRAAFLGISYGDQVQFFQRSLVDGGHYPNLPLMEDVELSMRMQALGRQVFLWQSCHVSPRRWQSESSFQRASLVIRLTGEYLLRRLFGPVDTVAMYQRYYSFKPPKGKRMEPHSAEKSPK